MDTGLVRLVVLLVIFGLGTAGITSCAEKSWAIAMGNTQDGGGTFKIVVEVGEGARLIPTRETTRSECPQQEEKMREFSMVNC